MNTAIWSDINANVLMNGKPLLITNLDAISGAIYNILRCPIGTRTLHPTFGSILPFILWEQISKQSAGRMRVGAIEAIEQWEKRILPIPSDTFVIPSSRFVGYDIQVGFQVIKTGTFGSLTFTWVKN